MMWGRKKKPIGFALREAEESFSEFAIGGKKTNGKLLASESKNCDFGEGYLRAGIGVREYISSVGEDVFLQSFLPVPDRFFLLVQKNGNGYAERLGYLSVDGKVMIYDENLFLWETAYSFGKRMKPLIATDGAGNPQNLFIGESGLYTCSFDGTVSGTGITAASRVACFFKGRLFFVREPFTLANSAPYAATEFGEDIHDSGWIRFPSDKGNIVALLPLKEKLYAFYEYGIAEITLAGSAREFAFKRIGYGGGRIFGDSAGVCAMNGEKAFFLAEDGVYSFDGARVKQVCKGLRIFPKRTGQVCDHASFEGKYFLVYTDKDGSKKGLVVDAESGEGYFSFAPTGTTEYRALAFCQSGGKVCVLSKLGELPADEESSFCASGFDFGLRGKKRLKRLILQGEGEMQLSLSDGVNTQSFAGSFENGRMELRPSLRGESFSLKIVLGRSAQVRALTAEAQALDRVK